MGGGLLSWGCQSSPLHRHGCLVSTPGIVAAPKSRFPADPRGNLPSCAPLPSVRSCHAPNSFRPCRSSRLRRLSPPGTFQVCCALKPIMGFATFPASGSVSLVLPRPSEALAFDGLGPARAFRRSPGGWAASAAAFRAPKSRPGIALAPGTALGFPWPSPVASHPSELFPSPQLYRVILSFQPRSLCLCSLGRPRASRPAERRSTVRAGSPRAVPSRRCLPALPPCLRIAQARCAWLGGVHGSLDLRAFVRCEVRCVRPTFPPAERPMLPWALPIEGLLTPRRGCRPDAPL